MAIRSQMSFIAIGAFVVAALLSCPSTLAASPLADQKFIIVKSYPTTLSSTHTSWAHQTAAPIAYQNISSPTERRPLLLALTAHNSTAKAVQTVVIDPALAVTSSTAIYDKATPAARGIVPNSVCSRGVFEALNATHVLCDAGHTGAALVILHSSPQQFGADAALLYLYLPVANRTADPVEKVLSIVPIAGFDGRFVAYLRTTVTPTTSISRTAAVNFTLEVLDMWSLQFGEASQLQQSRTVPFAWASRNGTYRFMTERTATASYNAVKRSFDIISLHDAADEVEFGFQRVAFDPATCAFDVSSPLTKRATGRMWRSAPSTKPGVTNFATYADFSFDSRVDAIGGELLVLFSAWYPSAFLSYLGGINNLREYIYDFRTYNRQHVSLLRFQLNGELETPQVHVLHDEEPMTSRHDGPRASYTAVKNEYGACHLRLLCSSCVAVYCYDTSGSTAERIAIDPLDVRRNDEVAVFDLHRSELISSLTTSTKSGMPPLLTSASTADGSSCIVADPNGGIRWLLPVPSKNVTAGALTTVQQSIASVATALSLPQGLVGVVSALPNGRTSSIDILSSAFQWSSVDSAEFPSDPVPTGPGPATAAPRLPLAHFYHALDRPGGAFVILIANMTHLMRFDSVTMSSAAPIAIVGNQSVQQPLLHCVVGGLLVTVHPTTRTIQARRVDDVLQGDPSLAQVFTDSSALSSFTTAVSSIAPLGDGAFAASIDRRVVGIRMNLTAAGVLTAELLWQINVPFSGDLTASASSLFLIQRQPEATGNLVTGVAFVISSGTECRALGGDACPSVRTAFQFSTGGTFCGRATSPRNIHRGQAFIPAHPAFLHLLFVPMGNCTIVVDGSATTPLRALTCIPRVLLTSLTDRSQSARQRHHFLTFPDGQLVEISSSTPATLLTDMFAVTGRAAFEAAPFAQSTSHVVSAGGGAVNSGVVAIGFGPSLSDSIAALNCVSGVSAPKVPASLSNSFAVEVPQSFAGTTLHLVCQLTESLNISVPITIANRAPAPQPTPAPQTLAPHTSQQPSSASPVATPPPTPTAASPPGTLPPSSGDDARRPTSAPLPPSATPFATSAPASDDEAAIKILDSSRPARIWADATKLQRPDPKGPLVIDEVLVRLPYPGIGQLLAPLFPTLTVGGDTELAREESKFQWPTSLEIDNLRGVARLRNASVAMANAFLSNLAIDFADEVDRRGLTPSLNFQVVAASSLVTEQLGIRIEATKTVPIAFLNVNTGPVVTQGRAITSTGAPRGKAFHRDVPSPFSHPLNLTLRVSAIMTDGLPLTSCLRVAMETRNPTVEVANPHQVFVIRGLCNDEAVYSLRVDGSDGYRYVSATVVVNVTYLPPMVAGSMPLSTVKLGREFVIAVPTTTLFIASSELRLRSTMRSGAPLPWSMRLDENILRGTIVDEGRTEIKLVATDVFDGSAEAILAIDATDDAPRVVGSFPATILSAQTEFTITMVAQDRVFADNDDDRLAFSLRGPSGSALPSWLTVAPTLTGFQLSGNAPRALMDTTLALTAVASDGFKQASTSLNLTFMPNRPPRVKKHPPNATFSTDEPVTISLAINDHFDDPDHDDLHLVEILVDGEKVTPVTFFRYDSGTGMLYADPTATPSATHHVSVAVADPSGATAEIVLTIELQESWYAFIERNWIFFTAIGSTVLSLIGLYWYYAQIWNFLRGTGYVIPNPLLTEQSHRLPPAATAVQAFVKLESSKRSFLINLLARFYKISTHYWYMEVVCAPLLSGDPIPNWLAIDDECIMFNPTGPESPRRGEETVIVRVTAHSGIILEEFECNFSDVSSAVYRAEKLEMDDDGGAFPTRSVPTDPSALLEVPLIKRNPISATTN